MYPTLEMANFVDRLETVFCVSFEGINYIPGVLARLYKSAEAFCTFLKCKEVVFLEIEEYGKVVHESMHISCPKKV